MTAYRHADGLNDVLVIGDEGLALTESQLLRLGPIAITLIDACEQPSTVADLEQACLDAFGPAPDGAAEQLVAEAIEALVGAGVLTSDEPDGRP